MDNELKVPNHIAIILDGNGRWAKKRNMPRGYGHIVGCDNLEKMCDVIKDMGVKYLTVYAFSTENWKRSRAEVEGLLKLFRQYLKRCIKKAHGSRDEILRGMTRMIEDVKNGTLAENAFDENGKLTEQCFESYLDTAGIPDPDLLIRTSGEQRLSNYLMWQLAYTEFYFTEVPWPDFHEEELRKAIEQYNNRDRRYGGVKEE